MGQAFFSVVILALMKVSDLTRSTISMNERIDKQTNDAIKKKGKKKKRTMYGRSDKEVYERHFRRVLNRHRREIIASKLHT